MGRQDCGLGRDAGAGLGNQSGLAQPSVPAALGAGHTLNSPLARLLALENATTDGPRTFMWPMSVTNYMNSSPSRRIWCELTRTRPPTMSLLALLCVRKKHIFICAAQLVHIDPAIQSGNLVNPNCRDQKIGVSISANRKKAAATSRTGLIFFQSFPNLRLFAEGRYKNNRSPQQRADEQLAGAPFVSECNPRRRLHGVGTMETVRARGRSSIRSYFEAPSKTVLKPAAH
jgi:hypothetical protein